MARLTTVPLGPATLSEMFGEQYCTRVNKLEEDERRRHEKREDAICQRKRNNAGYEKLANLRYGG